MRVLLAAAVSICLLATTAVPADSAEATDYVPPVDAPVIDEFRPPPHRYGPGNRGLEYRTRPGQIIRAAAVGTVSFAGNVGGRLVVSIRHPDGLRTTYSGLASVSVARSQPVAAEAPIGTASTTLHFGVRAGDAYLDPAALLGGRRRVFLVADDMDRRITPAYAAYVFGDGGNVLTESFDVVVRTAGDVLDDPLEAWTDLLDLVEEVAFAIDPQLGYSVQLLREWNPVSVGLRMAEVWQELNRECTPSSTSPPPPPSERRVLVVVGGIGSEHDDDLVEEIGPAELGYDTGDVVRFSYGGGATPGTGTALGLDETTYDGEDTEVGLRESAELLDELLVDVRAATPRTPIDIVAHSQGGVLVRLAVDDEGSGVARVVTLGSPHRGADVASGLSVLAENNGVAVTGGIIDEIEDAFLDDLLPRLDSPAIADLAEGSEVMRDLPDIPADVELTSVGSLFDPVVPNVKSRVGGHARWTVVNGGWHGSLPGSDVGQRETALALAGLPPTCRSLFAAFGDALVGEGISALTDGTSTFAISRLGRFDLGPSAPATSTIQVPDRAGR